MLVSCLRSLLPQRLLRSLHETMPLLQFALQQSFECLRVLKIVNFLYKFGKPFSRLHIQIRNTANKSHFCRLRYLNAAAKAFRSLHANVLYSSKIYITTWELFKVYTIYIYYSRNFFAKYLFSLGKYALVYSYNLYVIWKIR